MCLSLISPVQPNHTSNILDRALPETPVPEILLVKRAFDENVLSIIFGRPCQTLVRYRPSVESHREPVSRYAIFRVVFGKVDCGAFKVNEKVALGLDFFAVIPVAVRQNLDNRRLVFLVGIPFKFVSRYFLWPRILFGLPCGHSVVPTVRRGSRTSATRHTHRHQEGGDRGEQRLSETATGPSAIIPAAALWACTHRSFRRCR